MKKIIKKIWNTLTTVIVAAVVIIAVFLIIARLSGLRAYTVLSGSMEPAYHTGSLVFVKSADADAIKEGDVITFMIDDNTVVTHRITAIRPDESDASVLRFKTKGDANDTEDANLVHENNIIGVVKFSVPFIGYAANYIQHPPGTYIAIAFALVILIFAFIPEKSGTDNKKYSNNNSEISE